jgi:hypothetical protein
MKTASQKSNVDEARSKPRSPSRRSKSKTAQPAKNKVVLTQEQQATLDAVHEMDRRSRTRWDALTPAEQKEEYEGWLRAMRRMNEDRKGYRQVFVEDKA